MLIIMQNDGNMEYHSRHTGAHMVSCLGTVPPRQLTRHMARGGGMHACCAVHSRGKRESRHSESRRPWRPPEPMSLVIISVLYRYAVSDGTARHLYHGTLCHCRCGRCSRHRGARMRRHLGSLHERGHRQVPVSQSHGLVEQRGPMVGSSLQRNVRHVQEGHSAEIHLPSRPATLPIHSSLCRLRPNPARCG